MKKPYSGYILRGCIAFASLISSCSKDHSTPVPMPPVPKPLATLGLYEVDTSVYKRVFIPISKVGTQGTTVYYSVFDTGSTGMTIDATKLIPASMITSSGIQVTGDSVTVNGITITNQQSIVSFGNAQGIIREYGNLAYAVVTVGDQNGSIVTPRIPIFLYYKIVDDKGNKQPAHSNDVFGVGPGVSFANSAIASPLSYFKTSNGILSGFKLSTFNKADFTLAGSYVSNLLSIGLVPDDVSPSSGFVMHPLTKYSQGGYSPDILSTITYGGKSVSATVLFDTGTPAFSIIENNQASGSTPLPANTNVTITTNNGFTYSYTTAGADNLTTIANPFTTGDPRTIFSIDFFTENEFLLDYQGHEIGLKNN